MPTGTPEQVLKSIVNGINAGNLDGLMTLYDPKAAFTAQPGSSVEFRVDFEPSSGKNEGQDKDLEGRIFWRCGLGFLRQVWD